MAICNLLLAFSLRCLALPAGMHVSITPAPPYIPWHCSAPTTTPHVLPLAYVCPPNHPPTHRRSGADKVSIGGDAVDAAEAYYARGGTCAGDTAIEQISQVYGKQAVVVSGGRGRGFEAVKGEARGEMEVEGQRAGTGVAICVSAGTADVTGNGQVRQVDVHLSLQHHELVFHSHTGLHWPPGTAKSQAQRHRNSHIPYLTCVPLPPRPPTHPSPHTGQHRPPPRVCVQPLRHPPHLRPRLQAGAQRGGLVLVAVHGEGRAGGAGPGCCGAG